MAFADGVVPNPAVFADLYGEERDIAERIVLLQGPFVEVRVAWRVVWTGGDRATLPVAGGTIETR